MIKIKTNQTKLAKYLGKTKQTITYRKIHHPKDFYLFSVGFAFENEQYEELLKNLGPVELKKIRETAINLLDHYIVQRSIITEIKHDEIERPVISEIKEDKNGN